MSNNNFNKNKSQAPQNVFVNPYTFIKLSEEKPVRESVKKGEYTGKISCNIEVKTPVFIPNTTFDYKEQVEYKEKKFEHKHNVFYSYADLSKEKSLTPGIKNPKNPVIPGSEIRGMIRNVYEQLTNSCFSEVDEFNLPYKRTNEPKELCIMCWDEDEKVWKLYFNLVEKEDYYKVVIENDINCQGWNNVGKVGELVTKFDNTSDENQIKNINKDIDKEIKRIYESLCDKYISNNAPDDKKVSYTYNNDTKKITVDENGEYYLHIPVLMSSKKDRVINKVKQRDSKGYVKKISTANKQIIYTIPSRDSKNIIVDEKTLDRFEKVLGVNENVKGGYSDEKINQNKDAKKIYENYIKHYENKDPLIVYVDKASIDAAKKEKEADFKNRVIYLSPACMGKEFFENKIPDILKKNAEHDKCTSIGNACPACRLFGMIGEKGAVKGRLRFSDSYGANKVEYLEDKTLPILATPRISATEFYLRAPEIWKNKNGGFDGTWNYDYYTTYTEETPPLFNRNNYTPEPAGRKVYWNRTFEITNEEKGKMNNTITPIENGIFSFDVYFEKLTKDELENLLFCLELNDNNSEKPSVHKIGHGKPLGMGQIKVTVGEIECIEYTLEGSAISRKNKEYCSNLEKISIIDKIAKTDEGKCILRYSTDIADKAVISYPIGKKWNKQKKCEEKLPFVWFAKNRGSVSSPKIKQVLPIIAPKKESDPKLKSC